MKTLYHNSYVKLRGYPNIFKISGVRNGENRPIKKREFRRTQIYEVYSVWTFSTLKDYKYNAELNIWVHKSNPDLDIIEAERK